MSNIDLLNYEPTTISLISNQVIKTVFTKEYTKVKLKTNFPNVAVKYVLTSVDGSAYKGDVFSLDNNYLLVKSNGKSEKVSLSVVITEGEDELVLRTWELNLLTEEESKIYHLEHMRYNNNKASYVLGMVGIFGTVISAFVCLNSVLPKWFVLLYILLTIAILLVGFLCSEKTKTYKINYAYTMGVLGLICFALIFWLPLQLIIQQANGNAGGILGLPITGDHSQNAYLPSNGTVRGIIAIVSYLIAGIAFCSGSLIGYSKANKLNKYLATLKK